MPKQTLLVSPWHIHFSSGRDQDDDDAAVSEQGQQEHDPDGTPESPPVEQVVAGQEGPWSWHALKESGNLVTVILTHLLCLWSQS